MMKKYAIVAFATFAFLSVLSHHLVLGLSSDPALIQEKSMTNIQNMLQTTLPENLVLLRFDQLADTLIRIAQQEIGNKQEQINYVMNGLLVSSTIWRDVLYDPIKKQSDLSLFLAAMLGLLPGEYGINPYPGFLESREKALGTRYSFEDRIFKALQDVNDQLSPRTIDLAPVYDVTYGYMKAT